MPRENRKIINYVNLGKTIAFLFLLLLATWQIQAQQVVLDRLGYENGLPTDKIYDIDQDSTGFLWMTSPLGIIKFDGSNHSLYPVKDLGNEIFTGSGCKYLYRDNAGGIWTTSRAGAILSYDPLQDKFLVRNDSATRLPEEAIAYHQDSIGNFWFGFVQNGLHYWDRETRSFIKHRAHNSSDSLASNTITTISPAYDSLLYITTTRGTSFYNTRAQTFFNLWFNAGNGDSYKHNVIRHTIRNENFAFISTYGGVHITDLRTRKIRHVFEIPGSNKSINHNSVWEMVEADDGKIWMATYGGGVNIYDPETATFEYLTTENSNLPSNNLFGMFKDRDGSIWIRTEGSGLAKMDPRKQWIQGIYLNPKPIHTPTSVYLYNDTSLWIGTNGNGLLEYNLKQNTFIKYVNNPEDSRSLAYDNVSSLDMDDKGNLWVATAGGGIDRFDPGTGTFEHHPYRPDNDGVSNMAIKFIACLENRVFWATYGNGFGFYDQESGMYESYWEKEEAGLKTDFTVPNFMYKDKRGHLWITSEGGLIVFDGSDQRFYDIIYPENAEIPLKSFNIRSVYQIEESGYLAISDADEGLIINYQGSGNFTFSNADFPSTFIPGYILYSEGSKIWSARTTELTVWDMDSDSLTSFSKDDGLMSEANYVSYNQPLYPLIVPNTDGLSLVYAKNRPQVTLEPLTHLTGLSVLNQNKTLDSPDSLPGPELNKPLNLTPSLEFDYNDKEFSIAFSSIQYYALNNAIYRYRLKGFRDDWIETDQQSVSYTNLDPGNYTFEVQSAALSGNWGPPKSLSILINPPFWQTWWFILGTILIALGVLYYFHRTRIEKAVAIANLRTQIAQDLHDDLGASLTKISLFSGLLQESQNGNSKEVADQLGDLSRQAVSQMSDIVWSIDQKNDTIGDLITHMRCFASDTLENQGIELNFEKAVPNEDYIMNPLVRQNYFLIFKEAIHNIYKHARATHVWIRVRAIKDKLSIEIEDDGIGFTTAQDHDFYSSGGNGMGNMQKRADRIQLDFEIQLRDKGGTKISLKPA